LKTLATVYKEFLVLLRDPAGLALIFLMPFSLVVIMALIQDAPFRDYQEIKLEVVLVDLDGDSLAARVLKDFKKSSNVQFQIEKDSAKASELVKAGKFKAAIIIPEKATIRLKAKAKQGVSKLLANLGLSDTDIIPQTSAIGISVLFDPTIKSNYKHTLSSAIEKVLTNVQSEWLFVELQKQLEQDPTKKPSLDFLNMIQLNQVYASENKFQNVVLNSVQHNVPAWAMFAMFFILFPLAGNFIKEREEGSMLRLRLISNSYVPVITGKFVFYFSVCILQFVLMMLAGLYFMPVVGLQKLVLGNNIFGIMVAASVVAMAATSYGLLIATYFRTPQQALSFGSISVVILAAIGGIWVPVFVMPPGLQALSGLSPLNWSLGIFNDLFLREASLTDILPGLLKLLSFSGVALMLSIFVHKVKTGV
jgi:ABC-2 type transport system permease protein